MDTSGNMTAVTPTATLTASENVYSYGGGKAIIADYQTGQKINYSAEYAGLSFADNNLSINSTSGSLTIQNARDKLIEVADSAGNTTAYGYISSDEGELDGSNYDKFEVIGGGNELTNIITAGSGGSSLWGGTGGADTLTGGNGQDIFFFGKNDGADIINNAASSDVVNLYDVSLSDIVAANISGNAVSATFNTGATLQINSAENLSSTFRLADSSWKYNHRSNQWQ